MSHNFQEGNHDTMMSEMPGVLKMGFSQWAKSGKIFQGGAGPNFHHFPLKTNVYIVKHQKLGKSVGRNGSF